MRTNPICYILGHNEIHDMQWPVSWCSRCGIEMSIYDYEHDISKTLNIWNRMRDLIFIAKMRIKRMLRKMQHRISPEHDIPF